MHASTSVSQKKAATSKAAVVGADHAKKNYRHMVSQAEGILESESQVRFVSRISFSLKWITEKKIFHESLGR